MSSGRIVQIIGAVIDVEFPRNEVPKVYDALKVADKNITLEVQQQLGDGVVRTIAMGSTEGLSRGLAVNGTGAHPLYQWLTTEAPGILGSKAIKWNFTKFLIGRDGRVLKRYAPQDAPQKMAKDIEAALAA